MARKVTTKTKETVTKENKLDPVNVKADPVKAAPAKSDTMKKTPAKKPAAKKEMKVRSYVEYMGKQVEEKDMIAAVKKAWTRSGRKVGDIKEMDLYIKPEESAIYYVINGTNTGSVAF